jgi:preprotein translocase subunit SecB
MTKKRVKGSEKPSLTYENFLRSVRLIAIGMRDCRCSLDRRNYVLVLREKEAGLTRINAEYKLTNTGSRNFDASGSFSLNIEHKEKKNEVLSVVCSFEAHFHAEFGPGSELPKRFVDSELRLILWPYFRELTSNLTAKMAIRPVVVPLSTDA